MKYHSILSFGALQDLTDLLVTGDIANSLILCGGPNVMPVGMDAEDEARADSYVILLPEPGEKILWHRVGARLLENAVGGFGASYGCTFQIVGQHYVAPRMGADPGADFVQFRVGLSATDTLGKVEGIVIDVQEVALVICPRRHEEFVRTLIAEVRTRHGEMPDDKGTHPTI